MDPRTIAAYDESADKVAQLHKVLHPSRIYELIRQHFIPGGKCADIGCGTGRDSSWLASEGYDVIGIDASDGMLSRARALHPGLEFAKDSLPFLSMQGDELYDNVLCSAVIMHVPSEQIVDASKNLVRVTRPGGVIVLSYRGTTNPDHRESGKLYTPLTESELLRAFSEAGASLLHSEVDHEEGRGLDWVNLVFRKSPRPAV